MFVLLENRFYDKGICKYSDDFGNTAFIKRIGENCFVAKLRFVNKRIKAAPLTISVPFNNNTKGMDIHLDYEKGVNLDTVDVQAAITSFTNIVQRWICMLLDIKCLEIKQFDSLATNDLNSYKLSLISQYDELAPLIESVFCNKGQQQIL